MAEVWFPTDDEVPSCEAFMAISFECEGCGKAYSVRDELAGKTGQCKQCGHQMMIPTEPDAEGYGLEAPAPMPAPTPGSGSGPLRTFKPAPQSSMPNRPLFDPPATPSAQKKGFFSFGGNERSGAVGVLVVLLGIGARMYFKFDRAQGRNGRNRQGQNAMAPANPNGNGDGGPNLVDRARAFAADRSGPILLPRLPGRGPAREVEPGIMLHEIKLGPDRPPFGSPAGHRGKLWLYLPSGEHPAKSLPCVLITAAGSNLVTGMDLVDDDRPEHLPYVRAGFAVLAFELDGGVGDRERRDNQAMGEAMLRFLNARAGLVNAHIALEYALKKVPEVDPARISAAGHSSAGTLAVLFAEHEPRLKACAAFAPALDLERRFGPEAVNQFGRIGIGDLTTRYSPRNNLEKLAGPLFLFHAKDDSNVPARDSETFAAELRLLGRPVTLDLVDVGNHYDSMIKEGIPHAIDWLKGQGAGPSP